MAAFILPAIAALSLAGGARADAMFGLMPYDIIDIFREDIGTLTALCGNEEIAPEDEDSFETFVLPISVDNAILLDLGEIMVIDPPEVYSVGILRCDQATTQWLKTDDDHAAPTFMLSIFESNATDLAQNWIDNFNEDDFLSSEVRPLNRAETCTCNFMGSQIGQDIIAAKVKSRAEQENGGN